MSIIPFSKRRWLAATAVLLFAAAGLPGPARGATNNCNGCFAVVGYDGTLVRYRNVLYAVRNGTGVYTVVFKYPINRCAFTATSTTVGKYYGLAYTTFTLVQPDKATLQIFSGYNGDQTSRDTSFSLVIAC